MPDSPDFDALLISVRPSIDPPGNYCVDVGPEDGGGMTFVCRVFVPEKLKGLTVPEFVDGVLARIIAAEPEPFAGWDSLRREFDEGVPCDT